MFACVDFLLPSWLPKDADIGVPTWWWGGWDPTAILDQDYSHSFWWQENFAHLPHLPPRLLLFWDLPPKNFSLNFRLCFSKQMPLQNFLLSQSFSVMQSKVTRSCPPGAIWVYWPWGSNIFSVVLRVIFYELCGNRNIFYFLTKLPQTVFEGIMDRILLMGFVHILLHLLLK